MEAERFPSLHPMMGRGQGEGQPVRFRARWFQAGGARKIEQLRMCHAPLTPALSPQAGRGSKEGLSPPGWERE